MTQVEDYEGELSRIDKLLKAIRAEIGSLTLFMDDAENVWQQHHERHEPRLILFMDDAESTKKHRTALANISDLLWENGY